MRRRLRRFVVVGLVATVIDIGVLWVLADAGVAVWLADLCALAVASSASYVLHRTVTLHRSPFARWIHHPAAFGAPVVVAGAVDLLVLVSLDGPLGLVPAKLVAVAVAASVRLIAHRSFLFRAVREEQGVPARRPPVTGEPRLSVVVPAYREADRIATTVADLRAELDQALGGEPVEIIVVDDGSPDDTAEVARAAGADRVERLPVNRGKGAAVRTGMLLARGRTVAFCDADLSYRPVQLVPLLEAVEEGWDVVVGNRRHVLTRTLVRAGRVRELGGRLINLATHVLLLGQYRDTQCGIKAFRRDVAQLLFGLGRIDGFAFDVEVFHLVERYRLSLHEVPVQVVNSERSTVHVVRDGLGLVVDLVRVRRNAHAGRYEIDRVDLPEPESVDERRDPGPVGRSG